MADWTDVQGLRPLLKLHESRCAALKAETVDLRARLTNLETTCAALAARLTALEKPGPPVTLPKPPKP